jgi:O-succinylbenzoate synthase
MTYRVSFRSYRLPLRVPLRTAHGLWAEREGLLVRVEDDSGRVGYGEVAPIPWFGTETLAEATEMLAALGDRPAASALDAVPERFGCVRFALAAAREMVERDLRARWSESSGQETRPEAGFHPSSQRVPVTALLPAGRPALEALTARLEAGFLVCKWKVGVGDPADELALLDDLLARLPAYARLRLDANGAWDRRIAAKWLDCCAERPVEFVEQPLPPADEDGLRGLAGDFPVPLALDESVARLADARRWQSEGWPGLFVIKPAIAGPLSELLAWVAATKAEVVLSSAIETALGRAAVVDFALAHPELTKRAPGFGVGEVFTERRWNGSVTGPVLDADWSRGVNPEDLWNALS